MTTALSATLEGMKFLRSTPSLSSSEKEEEEEKVKKEEEGDELLTEPFINVCKLFIPIIDKLGPSMGIVKSDVGCYISRLESKYSCDPSRYKNVYEMVREEAESKRAKKSCSCTVAFLWLTRMMDFVVELLHCLVHSPEWSMPRACTHSYNKTLKQWHHWLATSSFTVALSTIPDRKKFLRIIGGSGDINSDIDRFCHDLSPLLQHNHKFLDSLGLDNLKIS